MHPFATRIPFFQNKIPTPCPASLRGFGALWMRRNVHKYNGVSAEEAASPTAEEGAKLHGNNRLLSPVALVIVAYVVTGMLQPTLVDVLRYRHVLGAPIAMLPMLGKGGNS
jgi:hypothetical protein